MNVVGNAPLKWHGGKSYLAKWIHTLAPEPVHTDREHGYTHRNIVFAGGLGEFWNWGPYEGISEVVNDLDGELANFWNVLSWPEYYRCFERIVSALPLGDQIAQHWHDWFQYNCEDSRWMICNAVAFFAKFRMSRQGLGTCYCTPTRRTRRGMNENVSAWLSAVEGLPDAHARLKRAEIRNLDFETFILQYDHNRALFYCDPPYMHDTRVTTGEYACEMSDADHWRLLGTLSRLKGRFILSGYHSELYDTHAALMGWYCYERSLPNSASSKKIKDQRIECVWTNYEPPQRAVAIPMAAAA